MLTARSRRGTRRRGDAAINPARAAFSRPKYDRAARRGSAANWPCGTTGRGFSTCRAVRRTSTSPPRPKTAPVMVHRAICGSIKRSMAVLFEHYAGHLPLWLSVHPGGGLAAITSDADDYGSSFAAKAEEARPAGWRWTSSERKDQLQGSRAFAGEDPGRVRRRRKEAAENTISIRSASTPTTMAARAMKRIKTRLDALHRQYPDYAAALKSRFLRQSAIRREVSRCRAVRGGPDTRRSIAT